MTPTFCFTEEELCPDSITTYKTIGDVRLQMHCFFPSDGRSGAEHGKEKKRPCAVFFFGGGWKGGSPTQFFPHCRYLANRGMVAVSAEYRVEDRHGTPPSVCVEDGKSAIRHLRTHAAEWGVDPERIAAGGGSAGGHVAAAAGTTTAFEPENEDLQISSRPNALILFNPVFDNSPDGYGYDRVQAYWQTISPMHNISTATPPTIVFLGTEDQLIPVKTAEDYQARMQKVGRRCDLFLYPKQAHGFFNYRPENNKPFVQTVTKMDQFLVSLDWLAAK